MSEHRPGRRQRAFLQVEELEHRCTPAVLSNPTTLLFTDVDGDRVTVQVSKGTLDLNNFRFVPQGRGEQLQEIDLAAEEFAGAKLSITARGHQHGNGRVDVGFINAAGIDLQEVRLNGDLGRINVGDEDFATQAIGLLRVHSLGKAGLGTQAPGGSLSSFVNGNMGDLDVATDIAGASFNVFAQFEFGPEGAVEIGGRVGNVTIGGSLIGGTQAFSGLLSSDGGFESIKIGGDLRGGDGFGSGRIISHGSIGKIRVGGSLIGGAGSGGAGIAVFSGFGSEQNGIESIFVGGDIRAGTGFSTAKIIAGDLGSLTVLGSFRGGSASDSGVIEADRIGSIFIKGDLEGTFENPIVITSLGLSRFETRTEVIIIERVIYVEEVLEDGTVIIVPRVIQEEITIEVTVQITVPAEIGSITVLGDVKNAIIRAEFEGHIDRVFVGGDWIASILAAGVYTGEDGLYGTDDDTLTSEAPSRVARIGQIFILGQIAGTAETGDHYGFFSQQIDAFFTRRGHRRLTPGPGNDDLLLAGTGDVRLREISRLPAPPDEEFPPA